MMDGMGWLGVWLAFGMLAADEFSGLPADTEIAPALALFYSLAGVFGIAMMVRRAVLRNHPARLFVPMLLSFACLATIAVLIYERQAPLGWVGTMVAAAGYLAFSACSASAGAVVAWRRREEARHRRGRETQAWERRLLLERASSGPIQQFAAELENLPTKDDIDPCLHERRSAETSARPRRRYKCVNERFR